MKPTKLHDISTLSGKEVQQLWEDAYTRFESPEEEIKKFIGRLEKIGQHEWKRDSRIVEIFCGRGNGLTALERLGFTSLEGVDISGDLLAKYNGKAKLYEADCRQLPFEDKSRDIIIVQGGLHHLPNLPADLDKTFSEVSRVLHLDGKFVVVEPWLTHFLHLIHFLSERRLIRKLSNKFDALATMIHYEADTYFQWLGKSREITSLLQKHFTEIYSWQKWGKLVFVGKPRAK
jgi:ubiquinone/menaquinone biosynthesis C-methylase UbiE